MKDWTLPAALALLFVSAIAGVSLTSIVYAHRTAALAIGAHPAGSASATPPPPCGESAGDVGSGSLHCGPGARASFDRDAGLAFCRCAETFVR